MTKLTTQYYNRVRWYMEAKREILDTHARSVQSAEKFKGSAGYKDLIAKADAERDAALNAERVTARKAMIDIVSAMRENVRTRKITPPTNEQLNLLTVLQMRGDNLTADEIRQAANNMAGCPAALAVLCDIARSRGLVVGLKSNNLTNDYITKRLDSMERSVESTLQGNDFFLRNVPKNEAECLTRWAYIGWKATPDGRNTEINQPLIDAFSAVVNGEGAE